MVKSKSSTITKLPKDQRSQFIIGPLGSWFLHGSSDIWTPLYKSIEKNSDNSIDFDQPTISNEIETSSPLSYFIYGSLGSFCFGQVNRHPKKHATYSDTNSISALTLQLVDVREDKSRVACCKFLKTASRPIAMVLTENGTFLIHDCIKNETLIHYNKNNIIKEFIESNETMKCDKDNGDNTSKKNTRFNVTQQINSCVWPSAEHAFLGVSLLREKVNLLLWLRLKDLTAQIDVEDNIIQSFCLLDLDNYQNCSPICCMDYNILDSNNCLIAVGMDDGKIIVVSVNYSNDLPKRIIKLLRNNYDQICSISFGPSANDMINRNFPLGLLATVSRTGLVLVWDIENEYYFADYQIPSKRSEINRTEGNQRINWFSVSFVKSENNINLIVSNADSGLTLLEIPSKIKASKIGLNDHRNKEQVAKQQTDTHNIRHWALIFNVVYDSVSNTVLTSSLDGNHIFWSCQEVINNNNKKFQSLQVKGEFLLPSMPNNARTHMIRHSPIKEDLMALALGQAGIRFHKIAQELSRTRFDMSPGCALIARKISKASLSPTCVAWHPSHEYRLAIGTLEGKVFRADLTPRKGTLLEADTSFKNKPSTSKKTAVNKITKKSKSDEGPKDVFDVDYKPLNREEGEVLSNDEESDCEAMEVEASKQSDGSNGCGRPKTDGVYSMCWGPNPICPNDASRLAIYATASISHRLLIYYNKKENSDRLTNYIDECDKLMMKEKFSEFLNEASEVTWKASMDLMALGTTNAQIFIYRFATNNNDAVIHTTNLSMIKLFVIDSSLVGQRNVQCLVWHPSTDTNGKYCYYLAAATNDSPIGQIFNLREHVLVSEMNTKLKITKPDDEPQRSNGGNNGCSMIMATPLTPEEVDSKEKQLKHIKLEPMFSLRAHEKSISDMTWSCHHPNQLATSSFDKSCLVWSLSDGCNLTIGEDGHNHDGDDEPKRNTTAIAKVASKFKARDSLFTVEWSLVDSDLIFTSGKDSIVLVFRPSENPAK